MLHLDIKNSSEYKSFSAVLVLSVCLQKITMRSLIAALSLSAAAATSSVPNFREHFELVKGFAEQYLEANGGAAASEYPYWNFIVSHGIV